jgi:hypothetical protein
MEQLKEQDAQSRMLRGRQQAILDKPARDFDAGKPGPFNRVSRSPNIANEAFNPRSGSDIATTPFSSLPVQAIAGKPIPGANPDLWNPGIITPEQDAFLTSREALNAKIASNRGMEHAARGATAGRKPK